MAEAQIGKVDYEKKDELIYDKNYKPSIVASSYIKQTSLLSNISGKPVLTEYYRQVKGPSEEPITLQPDSIETYQSYTRIKGLIAKLDGNTSQSFDEETGIISEEGIMFLIFDLAPLLGDVFIADVGDGLGGLFTISSPPRIIRISMDKIYEVDFKRIAFMNPKIEENLRMKTVQELVYSKDSAIRGGDAVITASDYELNKELNQVETLLSKFMCEQFMYPPEKTFVLPDQKDILYDPNLTRFLQCTINTRRLGLRDGIRVIGTEIGKMSVGGKKLCIWDMFLSGDYKHPQLYKQQYYVFQSASLINTKYYGGVYYSKIDRVITTEKEGAGSDAYRYISGVLVGNQYPTGGIFPTKSGEEYKYFFSDDFYTGNPTKPNEKFIYEFFRDGTVDKAALLKVIEGYWKADKMEQLYMGGIYLLAIRIAMSTTYKYM